MNRFKDASFKITTNMVNFLNDLQYNQLLTNYVTGTENKRIVVRSVLQIIELPVEDIYVNARLHTMWKTNSKDLSDAYRILSSQCL